MTDDSTMTRLPRPGNATADEYDEEAEVGTYEPTVPELTVPEFLPTDELKRLLEPTPGDEGDDGGFDPYDRS